MNDPKNSIEKDCTVDQIQKLLKAVAGYDPCTSEQQVVRNDKGEVEVSFAPGSIEPLYAQTKRFILLNFFGAVQNKDLAKIKGLIEQELVDIDAKTPMLKSPISETTALGFAINQGNSEEIIDYLLDKGADPRLAFDDFKRVGNINGINQLIKIAPDSVPKEVQESKQLATLRFFVAVEKQDLNTIKDLIEKELVNINAKETINYKKTALGVAFNQGSSKEIIDYLLDKGANPRLAFDDLKEAGNIPGLQQLREKSPEYYIR